LQQSPLAGKGKPPFRQRQTIEATLFQPNAGAASLCFLNRPANLATEPRHDSILSPDIDTEYTLEMVPAE
jgi:hypothetical protein